MRIIAAIGLAFAAAAAFAQVDPSRTVATVNGDTITGEQFYEHMEFLPNMNRTLESGEVVPVTPGLLAIVELVNQHLLLQLAKQKNLFPTDAQVDASLKQSMADDPHLLDRWIATGRTEEQLKGEYRTSIAQFNLRTEGITVSDQEVADFYHKEQIPGLTVSPRTVTFRVISVANESDEKAVDTDLGNGESFADVAKTRSNDITAPGGGLVGPVPTDFLPKDVAELLDSTKVGQSTPWHSEVSGSATIYVKYLVAGKEPQKPLDFDKMKETIRRKMMVDRGGIKNNVEEEMRQLRDNSKIDIPNKAYAAAYVDFMQKYYHETAHVGG